MDKPSAVGEHALVGIDWGSSNLRVALLDAQGQVLQRRDSTAGVFTVRDGNFASALWPLCGDWWAGHRVPLLACGMVGSRQGLVDVPYLPCPAGAADLARALVQASLQPPASAPAGTTATLHIVPGLQTGDAATGHDVMRGEETQLLGIATGTAALAVLPGTHSKWIDRGADGSVHDFQTYLTGELFDLLSHHGSLARVMAPPQWSAQAFDAGVGEARDGRLEDRLFRVRTAGLMDRFAAAALSDYLSGLLIGAELKAGLRRFATLARQGPVTLLGAPALVRRYARALQAFGHPVQAGPDDAVFTGLATIARTAGLLQTAASPSPRLEARP
jgi:2-dehydro-3-deoxygalactonokinase